jgi:hypothetical protein
MAIQAQYEIPVTGTLMVQIGDEVREATEDDLRKMGYIGRSEPYRAAARAMTLALHAENVLLPGQDLVDARLNPLRYLFELTTYPSDVLTSEMDGQLGIDLRAIERVLRLVDEGSGLQAADLWDNYRHAREAAATLVAD